MKVSVNVNATEGLSVTGCVVHHFTCGSLRFFSFHTFQSPPTPPTSPPPPSSPPSFTDTGLRPPLSLDWQLYRAQELQVFLPIHVRVDRLFHSSAGRLCGSAGLRCSKILSRGRCGGIGGSDSGSGGGSDGGSGNGSGSGSGNG